MTTPDPAATAAGAAAGGWGLSELTRLVWRRRALLLGTMAFVIGLALLAMYAIPPRYTARATVMIDPREQRIVDIETVISRLSADDQAVRSEIEVIRSEEIASRAIRALRLAELPEINPELSPGILRLAGERLGWPWLAVAFGEVQERPAEPAAPGASPEVVERFLDRLEVAALGTSRVVAIDFTSRDPGLAARVANTVAQSYIDFQLEQKLNATRSAAGWLDQRLAELRGQALASERAVTEYRNEIVAEQGRSAELLAQQIAQTSGRLTEAEVELRAASERRDRVRALVAVQGPTAVFDVVEPQIMVWFSGQLVALRQTEAQLTADRGKDDPVVREVQAEIGALSERMAARMAAMIETSVEIAQAKVAGLQAKLEQLTADAMAFDRATVALRSLEREAEADVGLFRTFLARSKETAQAGLERSDAWIVSAAAAPARPSFPNKLTWLGAAFAMSLLMGGGLVFAAEELEPGYRDREGLARALGATVLAVIPTLGRRPRDVPPAEWLVREPTAAFAEAVRSLHTSLTLAAHRGEPVRAILVTSALPQEGKSSIVASLARAAARGGVRVVAVDADLRRGFLHRQFDLPNEAGLTDFLAHGRPLEEIVQVDRRSGAHVVTAGSPADEPWELLRPPRLPELLDRLRAGYDLVLIDSPPMLAVSDARTMAELVDGSVLVVRWRATPREAVQAAHEQLLGTGTRLLGAVLSQAAERAPADYGYGGYGYHR